MNLLIRTSNSFLGQDIYNADEPYTKGLMIIMETCFFALKARERLDF